MATTSVGFQLASSLATKHLTDADFIKGGYLVVDSYQTLIKKDDQGLYENYIPVNENSDGTIVKGSLCYCQAEDKFYQYNGSSWEESKLNRDAPTKTSELTNDSDFATNASVVDAIAAIPEIEAIPDSEIIALFSTT